MDIMKLTARVDEDYIIQQYVTATTQDGFRDHKERIENFKRVYRGEWIQRLPDGNSRTVKPLIENAAKRAIHDIAGLCRGARSSVVFVPESDSDSAMIAAQVRESIADTHWETGRGRKIEKKLYMDLIGTGIASLAVSQDPKHSDYPTFTRLDPSNCYPDVRNGLLQDMVYIEEIKSRVAARMFGDDLLPPDAYDTSSLVEYYDDKQVVRAIVYKSKSSATSQAKILTRWEHKLERVPIAFVQAETFDDAFRGLLDQAEGALTARNDIVQYMMDYIESMVHAPFQERGILNAEDTPGPWTIYHHDTTLQDTFMRRTEPAAPAGSVFGLMSYLGEQTQGETVQPPSRVGQVTQSIASGSFVNSTQGQLTTLVEELQDMMADLRQQATYIAMDVDEHWLDFEKPMVRAVGRKRTYTPGKQIDGYHFCRVQFGAMQGITKLDADVRVLNHKGAGLISDQTAREQVDYLDDPTSEQDLIDKETMKASFLQRIGTDPNIPPYIIANVLLHQSDGDSLIEAIRKVAPDLVTLPTPQEQQAGAEAPAGPEGIPQPQPGEPAGEPTGPVQGQIPGGGSAEPDLSNLIGQKPLQQLIVKNRV